MNSEQRAMADELDELAAGCAVYSPDQCATMIDGIGWIAMRHKLRKAAELLRALEQPASAAGVEGMVMVPREPTRDMILEGLKAGDWRKQGRVQNIWNAMLAAAPKPEDAS